MYKNITSAAQFADEFKRMDRHHAWTYDGLSLLWDHLSDQDIELDVIALDSEWVEYVTREEAIEDGYDLDDCIVLSSNDCIVVSS